MNNTCFFVVSVLIDIYYALSLLRAGYAYCEWKKKDGPGFRTFINALFYGFFGLFMEIYYALRKNCGKCKNRQANHCSETGKSAGKYDKACRKDCHKD